MASTFSTQKVALDEIATKIQNNRKRLEQSQALPAQSDSELGAMPAQYGDIIQDINAALAADPDNVAVQNMHAEKGKIVAEFQALKTAAAAMKAATAAIDF